MQLRYRPLIAALLVASTIASITIVSQAGAATARAGGCCDAKLQTYSPRASRAAIRKGYIALLVRCNAACKFDVTLTGRFGGKYRHIGATSKRLPANAWVKLKVKVHSDVQRAARSGLTVRYKGYAYTG